MKSKEEKKKELKKSLEREIRDKREREQAELNNLTSNVALQTTMMTSLM